jgi:hypothetical protein
MFLMIVVAGCSNGLDKARQDNLSEGEQAYVGYLSKDIMQHPIVDINKEQDYIDLYENGTYVKQVIVIFEGMEPPRDYDRLVELTGKEYPENLGGEPGTKNSYKGTVIYVKSWRYIE